MEIRTLNYFVTVAEVLNITKAAELLNMSQPPLSAQIKALEEELETTLFIRGKRHLTLTESGKLLYRRAKEILNLSSKASSEIISLSKGMTGTISLGLVEGMAPDIAAEWIKKFIIKYPNIKLRIMDGNSDELIEKLRTGLISLAIITAPYDQMLLNSFPVGSENIVALMHKDHPLAKKEGNSVTVQELVGEPLIVPSRKATIEVIYSWFKDIRQEPNIVCEMDNYLDAAAFASNNVGISIFPQTAYVLNNSIISKTIETSDRVMEYLFVWLKSRDLPLIEKVFIEFIQKQIPKISHFVNN